MPNFPPCALENVKYRVLRGLPLPQTLAMVVEVEGVFGRGIERQMLPAATGGKIPQPGPGRPGHHGQFEMILKVLGVTVDTVEKAAAHRARVGHFRRKHEVIEHEGIMPLEERGELDRPVRTDKDVVFFEQTAGGQLTAQLGHLFCLLAQRYLSLKQLLSGLPVLGSLVGKVHVEAFAATGTAPARGFVGRAEGRAMIPPHPVLLDCLVHLAWCDGSLQEPERDYLRELFTQMGLTIEEQDALLAGPRPLPADTAICAACPDPGTRREFLKIANCLTRLDENLDDSEWLALRHILQAFMMHNIRHWDQLQNWLA